VTGSPRLAFSGMSSGNFSRFNGCRWLSGRLPHPLNRRRASFKVSTCRLILPRHACLRHLTLLQIASIAALRLVIVYRPRLCSPCFLFIPLSGLKTGHYPMAFLLMKSLSMPVAFTPSHQLSSFYNHHQVAPPSHTASRSLLSFISFLPFPMHNDTTIYSPLLIRFR
jgi:hypothetical protein